MDLRGQYCKRCYFKSSIINGSNFQCPRYYGDLGDLFDEDITEKIIAQKTLTDYRCYNNLTEMMTVPKDGYYAFVIKFVSIEFVNDYGDFDLYDIDVKTGKFNKDNDTNNKFLKCRCQWDKQDGLSGLYSDNSNFV